MNKKKENKLKKKQIISKLSDNKKVKNSFKTDFKKELNKELKKNKERPAQPKWKTFLLTAIGMIIFMGVIYAGHQIYLEHTQHLYGINLTQKQQKSFVNSMRKYVGNAWRPKEVATQVDKKYSNFSSKNKQQLAYLVYRSQQNTALYYNSYLYFMQAEFSYYDVNSSKDPVNPKVNNKTIPSVISDIKDNHEIIEYVGNNAYTVMPDFKWTLNKYHPTGEFKSFLTMASQESNYPIFSNKKQNIGLTYNHMINAIDWAQDHRGSELYQDAMSLAKFYYLALFQINNGLNITQNSKSAHISKQTVQDLERYDTKNNYFKNDLHNFIKQLKKNNYTMTAAMQATCQSFANSYFGDSVFDNFTDSIGGAPKVTQTSPDTRYGDNRTNQDKRVGKGIASK